MEHFEIGKLFSRTGKFDRLSRYGLDGKGRAASGIAIQLCQDHAGDIQQIVKGFRHIDGFLTGHGVYHQQNIRGSRRFLQPAQLVHQLFVDLQTASGIDDHIVVAVIFGVLYRLLRGQHGVLGPLLENRGFRLFRHDLQLLDGGGAVNISRYQQRPVSLAFQRMGKLCRMSGFTGTLQAAHHNNSRRVRGTFQTLFASSHQGGELLIDDLDHHLRGGQAFHHCRTNSALRHLCGKFLCHLIVDIGLQKGQAHLAHGLLYVCLRQLSLASQLLKRIAQLIGQSLKRHACASLLSVPCFSFLRTAYSSSAISWACVRILAAFSSIPGTPPACAFIS